jgi:hypothetical protein
LLERAHFNIMLARELRATMMDSVRRVRRDIDRISSDSREAIASSMECMSKCVRPGSISSALPGPSDASRDSDDAKAEALKAAEECEWLLSLTDNPEERVVLLEIRQFWIALAYLDA